MTALITAASLTLLMAFAIHDFSLRYVWEHSSRAMSMDLVLAAFHNATQAARDLTEQKMGPLTAGLGGLGGGLGIPGF